MIIINACQKDLFRVDLNVKTDWKWLEPFKKGHSFSISLYYRWLGLRLIYISVNLANFLISLGIVNEFVENNLWTTNVQSSKQSPTLQSNWWNFAWISIIVIKMNLYSRDDKLGDQKYILKSLDTEFPNLKCKNSIIFLWLQFC